MLLTTQYLDEAERLAGRIVVIHEASRISEVLLDVCTRLLVTARRGRSYSGKLLMAETPCRRSDARGDNVLIG